MPKIIADLRSRLIAAAKHALLTDGYTGLSLRSLAKECGVAVGTIYNYFDNKNTLVANVILVDWAEALERMDAACACVQDLPEGFAAILNTVKDFAAVYAEVFAQFVQSQEVIGISALRHRMLRGQIADRISRLLERFPCGHDASFVPILAETVIACASQSDVTGEMIAAFAAQVFRL